MCVCVCVCVQVIVFCVPHSSWSLAIRCLAASRGVSLQLKGGSAGCLLFARLAEMDFCHFFSLSKYHLFCHTAVTALAWKQPRSFSSHAFRGFGFVQVKKTLTVDFCKENQH